MTQDILRHTARGALSGIVGTGVLQAVVFPAEKYLPSAHPPQAEDPATFMLWQVEKKLPRKTWLAIPKTAETAVGFGLSFAYGATFGVLYAALNRRKSNILVDGTILGLVCWAVGYLGWLPATRLIPPPWKQTPAQFVGPVVEHIAYGIATVAAYQLLNKKW